MGPGGSEGGSKSAAAVARSRKSGGPAMHHARSRAASARTHQLARGGAQRPRGPGVQQQLQPKRPGRAACAALSPGKRTAHATGCDTSHAARRAKGAAATANNARRKTAKDATRAATRPRSGGGGSTPKSPHTTTGPRSAIRQRVCYIQVFPYTMQHLSNRSRPPCFRMALAIHGESGTLKEGRRGSTCKLSHYGPKATHQNR